MFSQSTLNSPLHDAAIELLKSQMLEDLIPVIWQGKFAKDPNLIIQVMVSCALDHVQTFEMQHILLKETYEELSQRAARISKDYAGFSFVQVYALLNYGITREHFIADWPVNMPFTMIHVGLMDYMMHHDNKSPNNDSAVHALLRVRHLNQNGNIMTSYGNIVKCLFGDDRQAEFLNFMETFKHLNTVLKPEQKLTIPFTYEDNFREQAMQEIEDNDPNAMLTETEFAETPSEDEMQLEKPEPPSVLSLLQNSFFQPNNPLKAMMVNIKQTLAIGQDQSCIMLSFHTEKNRQEFAEHMRRQEKGLTNEAGHSIHLTHTQYNDLMEDVDAAAKVVETTINQPAFHP